MLARIQQSIVASLVLIAALWITLTGAYAPSVTVIGLLVLLLGHAGFLALEFVLAYGVNRHDVAPKAGVLMLARAWLGEALTAPGVFLWQQPFRWNAVPDCLANGSAVSNRRGIVFVHGFACNRGFWNPWLVRIKQSGQVFSAVSLAPVLGSIDQYAPVIEAAVQRVTAATGLSPLLICHSMGGLAVRAWLNASQADQRVHHVITIGTPHHGTWLGRFSPSANGRQMRQSSNWLAQLAGLESPQRRQLFTCYYSNCDNIVFPASTATLPGADNRLVPGVAHVALAFNETVMRESLAMARLDDAGALAHPQCSPHAEQ
jgi:triacylglycerol esterase/lipase EstA (alpha/beta hydrolase family)